MAKKLFDSPYGKGVALNFKIDQAPYRQMIKDNKAEAKAREAARKKKEQDLNNILKSITYDDKNVLERHRPNARAEYAATIDDIIKYNKSQDLGSLYKRIGDFNSTMRTYGDEKLAFDSYVKAASDGKHWASQDYIADVNNTEISDVDIVDRHSDVMQYNKESGTFSEVATNKKDPLAFVNKAMQGMSPMFSRGDDGKLKSTGRLSETGDYLFLQSKAEDPETFYNELAATWIQDPENVIHTQNALGLTAEEYMEAPIKHARELLDPIASAKMFKEVAKKEPTQKDSKGFSFGSGGAKSKRYSIMATDRPIDLSKEIGGELIGYDISDIGSSQGVRKRPIKVSKGSYFAKGGDRFIKVSNAASGEGVNLQAEPAGIYMRKDKPASEGVWLKYRTSYAPSDSGGGVQTQTSGLSVPSVDELYSKTDAEVDFFVPINSISEANQFISSMGLPKSDYERLLSDLKKRFNQTTTQSSSEITNPFD